MGEHQIKELMKLKGLCQKDLRFEVKVHFVLKDQNLIISSLSHIHRLLTDCVEFDLLAFL